MDKILAVAFDTEEEAYKGVDALRDLHKGGDITLYATAVLTKDENGTVTIKDEVDHGPIGTGVGTLTDAVVGLLGGPTGAAVHAVDGGLTGLVVDTGNAGVNVEFLDEVSEVLTPGTAVVLADVDEELVTLLDTTMEQMGGVILRQSRSEVAEDQLNRDAATLKAEQKSLQEELKASGEETKARAQNTINSLQQQGDSIKTKAETKLDQIKKEADAKIDALKAQLKKANDKQKVKIEKRMAEKKTDKKIRSEKLQQARKLASQTLTQ